MKGTRVVITGAADGIGLGIARCFVEAGAEVQVCDFSEQAVNSLNQNQESINAHVADVSDPESVNDFIAAARSNMGGIDVLINNVGVAGPHAFVEDMSIDDWENSMRANVSGMFYAIKAVVGEMKDRGSGVILNTSSAGTITLPPKRSVYNTSKAAVEGLTRSLARELGPFNIRCNAILPGVMNNERMNRIMTRRSEDENRPLDEIRAEYLEGVSMGSLVDVEDVGNMAVFLASEKARYVTGQLIAVCAGLLWEN